MNPPKKTDLKVPIEEIPLPPKDLTDELDNAPAAKESAPARPDVEVAELEFLSDPATRTAVVPLNHPFLLDGVTVDRIAVRRLSVAEVGRIASRMRDSEMDAYDVYAEQTGLPAPVLRGLLDDDGDAVTEKCQDFFPRVFRTDDDLPPGRETGEE